MQCTSPTTRVVNYAFTKPGRGLYNSQHSSTRAALLYVDAAVCVLERVREWRVCLSRADRDDEVHETVFFLRHSTSFCSYLGNAERRRHFLSFAAVQVTLIRFVAALLDFLCLPPQHSAQLPCKRERCKRKEKRGAVIINK